MKIARSQRLTSSAENESHFSTGVIMKDSNDSTGLLVFLADWIRSTRLRRWALDPSRPWSEVTAYLRTAYALDDDDLGTLSRHDRPGLLGRVAYGLMGVSLENPPPWPGHPIEIDPALTAQVVRGTAPPAAMSPDDAVAWPGAMVRCLETVTLDERRPVLETGKEATLVVTGWNLPSPVGLVFTLSADATKVVDVPNCPVRTDAYGVSNIDVKVTLTDRGDWDLNYYEVAPDRSDPRNRLVRAIEVR